MPADLSKRSKELGIEYRLNTMVMDISTGDESENGSNDKIVTAMNRTDGLFHIAAKTVYLRWAAEREQEVP